jgi:hypothetical protein
MYLVFSVFASRPTSLLASVKVPMFFFMVSVLQKYELYPISFDRIISSD